MWQQPYAMQFSMNFLDENAYEVRIYDRKLCGSSGEGGCLYAVDRQGEN